jgi:hypothetical protein
MGVGGTGGVIVASLVTVTCSLGRVGVGCGLFVAFVVTVRVACGRVVSVGVGWQAQRAVRITRVCAGQLIDREG